MLVATQLIDPLTAVQNRNGKFLLIGKGGGDLAEGSGSANAGSCDQNCIRWQTLADPGADP